MGSASWNSLTAVFTMDGGWSTVLQKTANINDYDVQKQAAK